MRDEDTLSVSLSLSKLVFGLYRRTLPTYNESNRYIFSLTGRRASTLIIYNRNLPIMEPRVFFVNEERPVRRDTLHFRWKWTPMRRRCDADARCQWTPPISADSNWTANGRRCDADADADTDATHKANGRNGFYPPRGALMI